jgi:dTDP-4-dehydrorhamnose reductase
MSLYKKIFVAGANGMLGTTLQGLIKTEEHLLTDREAEGNTMYCDIRDLNQTTQIVNGYKPEVILNFAALIDLEYCEKNKDTKRNLFKINEL